MNSFNIHPVDDAQQPEHQSFVGGRPSLPPDIPLPHCGCCESLLTFFFQLAFPVDHDWAGRSVAVFACTSCADEDRLIPEMLPTPVGAVPEDFLRRYESNFRTLVFRTDLAEVVNAYLPKIRYMRLEFVPHLQARSRSTETVGSSIGLVGGQPNWLLDDETPLSVAGDSPVFLFQLFPGLQFAIEDDAPPQMDIGLDGRPAPSGFRHYELFITNALFAFGAGGGSLVYLTTQVD